MQSGKRVSSGLLFSLAAVAVAVVGVLWAGAGQASSRPASPSQDQKLRGLKVGYITITPVNQGSWDPRQYQAFRKVAKRYHWRVQLAETTPPNQAEQVLRRFAASGVSIVFSSTQTLENAIRTVAARYPKIKFVINDDLSKKPLPNERAYAVDWYQFGYLGGAAAALVSRKSKIGLITGQPIEASVKAFGAAPAGARKIKPSAQTFVAFTNDWLDPAKGAAAAVGLISSKGVDATFAIAGAMSSAILRADAEHNAVGIGSYADESRFAPGAVPTSVLLNWNVAYRDIVKRLRSGNFKAGSKKLTIRNGGITVLPFKGTANAKRKTARMRSLIGQIRSGKVHVPHTRLKP